MIDDFCFPHPEGCAEKIKTLTMTLEIDNKMATKYFSTVSDYCENEAQESRTWRQSQDKEFLADIDDCPDELQQRCTYF